MQFQKQNIFANLFSEWHQSAHLLDTPKTCWLSQTLIAQMMDYFSKTLAGGVVYKRVEVNKTLPCLKAQIRTILLLVCSENFLKN